MKISHLMLGDWVEVKNSDHLKYVQVGAIFINSILTQEAEYESEEIGINNLQPIQLTKEILLKNGFEDFSGGGCIIKELGDGEMSPFYIWDGNNSIYLVDYCSVNKYSYIKECKYVHEFQHELKSCGIEKEIVI